MTSLWRHQGYFLRLNKTPLEPQKTFTTVGSKLVNIMCRIGRVPLQCFEIISISSNFLIKNEFCWFAPQLFLSSTPTQCPWLWTREALLASSVRSTEYQRPTSPGRETEYHSTPPTTGNIIHTYITVYVQ